jgi:hypothetical protein
MKKLITKILIILSLSIPVQSHALDAKVSAVLLMAGYGTVGGALLGTASLAFGAEGRTVAKGASIGLYCGLLFGGYIVMSHQMRQNRLNNPEPEPETDDTYDDEAEGIFGYRKGSHPRQILQDFRELQVQSDQIKMTSLQIGKDRNSVPPLFINILNYTF